MPYVPYLPYVHYVPQVLHSFALCMRFMCLMVVFLDDTLAAFVNHGAEITVRPGTNSLASHCI